MIFPECVLGRSSLHSMRFGRASLPICCATCSRIWASISGVPSSSPWSVTNATIAWPVSSSDCATTAASATFSCATIADSTSAVERRCPETLITSSIRPTIHRYPSLSRIAASPTR